MNVVLGPAGSHDYLNTIVQDIDMPCMISKVKGEGHNEALHR